MAVESAEEHLSRIYVVSDGTGDTAAAVAQAAMAQFNVEWRLRRFVGIRHESMVQRVVVEAEEEGALIVFTLVDKRLARELLEEAARRAVPTVDVLGSMIAQVARHLRAEPRDQPGLLHGFSDEYFRRIEAVEFAVRHDDGANLHTLHRADLVLTGISRTSKTPLSMYLAQRGYRTGNVPIIPGIDPPRLLFELDPRKVFALTIDPSLLLTIRQARVRALGSAPYSTYADPETLLEEVRRARRIYREHGWKVIDITGRAAEENAARILRHVEQAAT
ncbi:MAG: kinase/pyrophosphorylase [Myxococcales bacterium]|nr:kinase/pyrophosphorylase [Myxococcales bacterium]MDH5307531.1 kinase/pyrophosphorylase [Myxococcales bacterium]